MTKTKLTVARIVAIAVLIVSLTVLSAFAFADTAAATPQTREFDDRFDRMLDDASGTDKLPAYTHVVWQAGQANTVTDPIFKMGHAKMESDTNPTSLTLTVRSTVTKVADLRLGLRLKGADSDAACAIIDLSDTENYPVEFSVGNDIGEDWTDMTFDFSQWDDIVFHDANNTNFSDPGVAISGFHLFADSTKGGELDIQKISFTGSTTSILYNFDDITDAYWPQSAAGLATTYGRHYAVTSTKQIASEVATSNNTDENYSAIVLSLSGDAQFTVAPVKADGTIGTAKAWTELTDLEGTTVPSVTDLPQNIVVSLASLGETAIRGVQFNVTSGSLNVYQAFFTNLEVPALEEAPRLDTDSIAYMTQFNFEYDKFGGDYNQGAADGAAFNLAYILSYGGETGVHVIDGHLVFDPTTDYTNAKIRSNVASEGRRYLVIKYKLQGGTLDNFRFGVVKTEPDEVTGQGWYNDLQASQGTLAKNTPYIASSGYGYLVTDLQVQFGVTEISGIDLYYTGTGTLYIDEIFYADKIVPEAKLSDNILTEDRVVTVEAGSGYAYVTGFDLDGKVHDGIAVTMKATEGATLAPARFEFYGTEATKWFRENSAGVLHDVYGRQLPDITTEEQTYIIDYAQSGIVGAAQNLHFHTEKLEAEVTYTITAVQYVDYEYNYDTTDEVLAEDFAGKEVTASATGYQYVGWASGAARTGMDYAILEVEGNISKLRLGLDDATIWFEENTAGTFVDKDGNMFDLNETGKRTLVIDLAKSGVPETVKDIHFHNDFAQVGDVLKITSLKFAKEKPYEDIIDAIPVNDDSKPVIDAFEVPQTGTVGQAITVTVTASDNYSTNVTTEVTVVREGNNVTVNGNKFTPDQAGTYTVTVTATDEAGNKATASKTVTVSAAGNQSTDPTNPADGKEGGFPSWAIALIVILAVVIIGVIVYFVMKKKKKNR